MKTQEGNIKHFQAAGKLMLFGEYLVLNGANCVAFPLKFGQKLEVTPATEITWESHANDQMWFEVRMNDQFDIVETNNDEVAQILRKLFLFIRSEKPELSFQNAFKAEANFQLNWGLGSSSTLISLLSQWSGVDAFVLSDASFGGSGYDIACATAISPLVYANKKVEHTFQFPTELTDRFLFVYLGNKQNSRDEIKRFQKSNCNETHVTRMNNLIDLALNTTDIGFFEEQLNASEALISSVIETSELKTRLFSDYPYSIKSLGAWGGDFFLATFRDLEQAKHYFQHKGYNTSFTYQELIK